MRTLLTMICAALLAVGFAYTAKAEVQNVRVGGDIEVRGIWQKDLDLDSSKGTPSVADFYYQIARVYVSADLTDDVNAYVRFINDRFWGDNYAGSWYSLGAVPNVDANDVNIDLAYITLNNIYGYSADLRIGRQELKCGEGFLIGDGVNDIYVNVTGKTFAYVRGPRKAFDAIRLTSRYESHTLDLFTAKIEETYGGATVFPFYVYNDADVYGVNWNYNAGDRGIYDVGLFHTVQNVNAYDNISKVKGDNTTTALALRGEIAIPVASTLKLKGEVVKQWGEVANVGPSGSDVKKVKRDAWGGYVEGEYAFETTYEPYVGLGYIYLSGDKKNKKVSTDPLDPGKWEGFDPMFTSETYGEIADFVYGGGRMTNAKIWKVSAGLNPVEKLNVDLTYYTIDTAEKVWTGTEYANKNVGDEYDLTLTYDYTEDVSFSLCYATFKPGKFWKDIFGNSKMKATATALLGGVKVTF